MDKGTTVCHNRDSLNVSDGTEINRCARHLPRVIFAAQTSAKKMPKLVGLRYFRNVKNLPTFVLAQPWQLNR